MKSKKKNSTRKIRDPLGLKSISRMLADEQKEVIRLLQNKEVLITNDIEKKIFVTLGNDVKKIRIATLYKLVNAGLVFRQPQAPFHYVLSTEGEMIEV